MVVHSEPFIKLSEGPVQSSDCMTPPPYAQLAHSFTLVQFPSTAPLILSVEFHIQKLLKCYIDKMLNFILKNRGLYRTVGQKS